VDGGLDFNDEAVLVKALTAREPAALAFLIDTYHSSLVRVADQYVPSRSIAEEVVQDTWLAVIEGIDRFEQRATVKTWLYRILLNIARSRGTKERRSIPFALNSSLEPEPAVDPHRFRRYSRRGRGQWKQPPEPWSDPEEHILATEAHAVIRQAVGQLPPDQREVLTMRDVLGWTATETCDALSITDTNQRVLLHRARAKLRTALEQHYRQGRPS
jgi:RNA polymerase sigma-70 factor (ECF subfamily)